MKRTLDEHIARMKKLSLINEDDSMAINQTTNQDPTDSPEFDQGIEDTLKNLLNDVTKDINQLGKEVGDRDGQLEIQGESININEAGFVMAAGAMLAAPKIIEMIGKGTRQLGIKTNTEWIKNAGDAATEAGKKLHHAYGNTIANLLKRIPAYRNTPDEKIHKIADGILLSVTVAAGIASLSGVGSALQAGQAGIAAVEGGLSGVKGLEVAEAARKILPNIMNGLFA